MGRGPEGSLQDRIVRMFRARGWLAQKNSAGAGWPDFTFISPSGFVLFAEFKAQGAKLRPIQEAWHKEMHKRLSFRKPTPPIETVIWWETVQAYDWLSKYHRYDTYTV